MKINRGAVAVAVALVLASAPVLVPPALAAGQGLTVKGDQRAWNELMAAFTKQSKVKSYRAKITEPGSGAGAGTIDFVNPDRYHVIMMGGQMESVQVGKEIRVRMGASSPWQCTGQPTPPPMTNPGQMTGEVEVARGPAVTINGVPTQSYTFSQKVGMPASPAAGVPNMTVKSRVFVANATGLPKRTQVLGDNDKVVEQFDYDYNVPITITLPACG
jgi:hypothetical protein